MTGGVISTFTSTMSYFVAVAPAPAAAALFKFNSPLEEGEDGVERSGSIWDVLIEFRISDSSSLQKIKVLSESDDKVALK